MHRENIEELARRSMRSASLFVWALLGFLIASSLWRYAVVLVAAFILIILAGVLARRSRRGNRDHSSVEVTRFPPLSREDWRVARSKLKKHRCGL
jgi:hypothetical protein